MLLLWQLAYQWERKKANGFAFSYGCFWDFLADTSFMTEKSEQEFCICSQQVSSVLVGLSICLRF